MSKINDIQKTLLEAQEHHPNRPVLIDLDKLSHLLSIADEAKRLAKEDTATRCKDYHIKCDRCINIAGNYCVYYDKKKLLEKIEE